MPIKPIEVPFELFEAITNKYDDELRGKGFYPKILKDAKKLIEEHKAKNTKLTLRNGSTISFFDSTPGELKSIGSLTGINNNAQHDDKNN